MGGRHILLLTDRDWTHPQGGGTGTNLYGQVSRWVAWGHKVTVIAGEYPGAVAEEQLAPNLTVHRMGSRITVFPRAALAHLRGVGRDADVAVEVVNGIAFFTPLWLRKPRVTLVHHVHRDHYATELGTVGKVAAFALETVPLRALYRNGPVLTISEAAATDLHEKLGVTEERITVSYLGVEQPPFPPAERCPEPRLLYLGRLKQYKRVELLLDVLAAAPDAAHLDIAGDGDHRPALEAAVAERGLGERVTFHGHVDERTKAELLSRSWLNLTASSAEGWCLTVMEAAVYGTPSASLRVGGLGESIVHGETGLLADEPEELSAGIRDLLGDPARCAELGENARRRAESFTWDRTATEAIHLIERTAGEERARLREGLRTSETMKATALAGATLASNAIALLFTVIFARLLGADGYGSLAALLSTFLILAVPGSALQVAVAREVALGRLGTGQELAATIAAWRKRLGVLLGLATVAAVLAREPLAALLSVDEAWGAAMIVPTAVLWLALSLERGALQGVRAYATVAWSILLEAGGRLVCGLVLVAAGLGVTGAYLGTPLSMLAATVVLVLAGRRRLGPVGETTRTLPLHGLLRGAWPAVLALFLIAVLQNIDVILVKRQIGGDEAGAYAAAAVAAKAIIWVAIGIGLYLLPEATRAVAEGRDPRAVLLRAIGIMAAVALPMLAVYALVPELVLRLAFGPETERAAGALPVLGVAMTLLALGYLCVQYMLALGQLAFLWILGLVAAAEVVLLGGLGADDLAAFAVLVLVLQASAALAVLALGLRRRAAAA
jgi:glycosyltransferase involved in cell wall biosynthesis/O-antigen/teichoic acid export membrane protein